jgi:hypothetical protein
MCQTPGKAGFDPDGHLVRVSDTDEDRRLTLTKTRA